MQQPNEEIDGVYTMVAFDSAIGSSVAVCHGGNIWERQSENPRGHAEALGALLAEVLEESGVAPADITHVVYGVGPGPFTGLRVGIAAAHAFALGAQAELFPLHSPEAVALHELEQGSSTAVRVVQDAKRRELFVTEYEGLDGAGIPQRTLGPQILTRAAYEERPGDVWPEVIPAGALLRLASRKLAEGREPEEPGALYLREPDVKEPAPVKRVST